MNVVFVTSESTPFGSTGGLADVSHALPIALKELGVDACRVMPFYRRHIEQSGCAVKDTGVVLDVPMGMNTVQAEIWATEGEPTKTYFIRRDEYFDRSELYGLPHRDYDDNFARFTFLQKAVVELLDAGVLEADVVHGNDWQTGLLPLFLRFGTRGMGRVGTERSVFTIHNLAYQGLFPGALFPMTSLPFSTFTVDGFEFYGQINFLKAGIVFADYVTTVSPTYAEEIQTPELGCGLHNVLVANKGRLRGILNGVDYATWDPEHDPHLKRTYRMTDVRGKRTCRNDLASRMGLELRQDRPLIGMISRLTEQKGFDILAEAMDDIMAMDVSFALLGTGQQKYHDLCEQWAARWPGKFSVRLAYDNALAHQIEGGADVFMMPSRFEPCGLNQLYSLRYGTLPVVSATGGLADTIVDLADTAKGTGFVMSEYTPAALTACVRRAVDTYQDRAAWLSVVKRVMKQDFSWSRSASSYLDLYEDCLDWA